LIDNHLLRRNNRASHRKVSKTTETHSTKYNKNQKQV